MGWPHGFITRGAQQNLFEWRGARVVHQERGRFTVDGPAVAPTHECDQRRRKVHALGGESILEAGWAILVLHLVQDVVLHEPAEPIGEQVASDAKIIMELAKAVDPAEDVSHDQQRPAISYQIERCFDGTRSSLGRVMQTDR